MLFRSVLASQGDRYTLENLVNNQCIERHVKELMLYNHDPLTEQNPTIEAMKDANEYIVEQVIQHRGDWKQLKNMSFRVRWKGYDEDEDTWEPWQNLKMNDKLHEYLRQIGQVTRIPIQYRRGLT